MKDEILGRYDELVAAITDISPHAWEALVAKQYADGLVGTLGGIVFFVLMLGGIAAIFVSLRALQTGKWKDEFHFPLCFCGAITSLIGLIIGSINMGSALPKLISPEGYALATLLRQMS